MKKFLFTLAALMMAGSAFAGNYFYIEPFEVPASALGATGTAARINVDVKAHFDNYVSAWDVAMTLPEGLTVQGVRAGSDLTLSYLDEFGDPATVTPTLNKMLTTNPVKVIVAQQEAGYDEDGITYGAVKWAPGDYNQMWIFVFNATADFAGGEVTINTVAACGNDTRPEVLANMADQVPVTTDPIAVTVEVIVDEVEFVDSKSESQGQQQVQQEQAQPMTPPPAMQTAMPEGPVPELELDGDAQLPFDVMGY